MKRLFLAVISIVLTAGVFGQNDQREEVIRRICGSQLDFVEMQKSDPAQYQRYLDFETQVQNSINSKTIPPGVITIPVVVHVVYNNLSQNISDDQIKAQINSLNKDYRRLNDDAYKTPTIWQSLAGDTKIEFQLAKVDPNGNPTTRIIRKSTNVNGFSSINDNVKVTSSGGSDLWNTQRYLNIWVCNLLDYAGYSTFPWNSLM